jgi:O-antigen/teichoic acid export membrane protein
MSNTKTIARNAGWYGLENLVSALVSMFTSIAIARTLGPSQMGYIIFVIWLSSVVASLGGLGIPSTTQKYIAEFYGMGDRGTARHIYFRTLWFQVALASAATLGLAVWVLGNAGSGYKIASLLVVLSVLPAMVNSIPAQTNVATEDLSRNLPASVVSIAVFFLGILGTVVFHWGVIGVGASQLLMRIVDCGVRLIPTTLWIHGWQRAHQEPHGLNQRMFTFAWQSIVSMLLYLVVWDRSEIILLKHFSDVKQIAYYSVAFNMAERLLLSSTIFASATGATIFAQYGRDKSRLPAITASTFRYLALSSFPVHFMAASLAFPALLLLYGHRYSGAAMVVTIAPLLCMPKAFSGPVQNLLQSNERQSYVINATILAGVIDIGVAWMLVRNHGAVGACIGSGAAQLTAVAIMWAVAIRLYKIALPWGQIAKIAGASLSAAIVAFLVSKSLSPLPGVVLGSTAALATLLFFFYLLRVLLPEDRVRFAVVGAMLPKPLEWMVTKLVSVLIRAEVPDATPSGV